MSRTVTVAELKQLLDSRKSIELIDVRKAHDFGEDPVLIPGARHLLPAEIDSWIGRLDSSREVIAYCVHGHAVSKEVVEALCARGMHARLLTGGIEAWKEAGNPTGTG